MQVNNFLVMNEPNHPVALTGLPNAFASACREARTEEDLYARCRAVLVAYFGTEKIWLTISAGHGHLLRLGPASGLGEAVQVATFAAGTTSVAIHSDPAGASTLRTVAMPLSFALAVLVELRTVLVERQAALEDSAFQLRALRQVSRLLATAHSVAETEQLILDFLAEVFGALWCCLYRPEGDRYVARAARSDTPRAAPGPVSRDRLDAAVPPGGATPGADAGVAAVLGHGVQLCIPLDSGDDRVAVVALGSRTGGASYGPAEHELAHTLSVASATALRNAELIEQLHSAATTDELTGLMNRRALEERLRDELARGDRHHLNTSVVLLDVDRFKAVNDSLGHAAGDRLLKLVATVLRRERRSLDSVGRLGGDEFLAILPMTSAQEARIFANRVQASLAALHSAHPDLGVASASMGVAQAPLHGHTASVLLAAADLALYRAKRTGRNAIELAEA